MGQKIPRIYDATIKRIADRDFPLIKFIEIENILKMYKSESCKGANRIYASILKLSRGNIELVKKYVEKANNDYRDIIALAEYPNFLKHIFDENLSEEQRKQLINNDWEQYETWLNKKS